MKARIANIIHSFVDYPSKEDSCITVFLSGCGHKCKGCHNKEIQNINIGVEFTPEELMKELDILSKSFKTKKVVFQGGDPLFYTNRTFLKDFVKINITYSVCVYTGYTIDEVKEDFKKGEVDYWKCGLFDESLKRISSKTDEEFILASSNQEFYDTNFKKISKKGILKFNHLTRNNLFVRIFRQE